ncbi:MAG TPA: lysophospholipid acyltransferase family protein [Lacipirellula sp.]
MSSNAAAASLSETDATAPMSAGVLERWWASARLALRMFAFVVGTLAFWAAMEIDLLVRRPARRMDVINSWTPRWSAALLRVFGIRVEAHGPFADQQEVHPGRDERGVGRIFLMNHRSGADIPIVLSLAKVHVISRHDVAGWPLIGAGGRRIGTLFVDRRSRRSGATVLTQISQSLEAGEGVAMFPEGTAYPGDEIREFKPGAFKAAVRSGAEIVPMGIAYSDPAACFVVGEPFLAHMKRVASLRRVRVNVEIGKPIRVDGKSAVELQAEVRRQMESLIAKARQRLTPRHSERSEESGSSRETPDPSLRSG